MQKKAKLTSMYSVEPVLVSESDLQFNSGETRSTFPWMLRQHACLCDAFSNQDLLGQVT